MIAKNHSVKPFLILILTLQGIYSYSQSLSDNPKQKDQTFYTLRGNNTIDIGAGTSVINGDLPDPQFEVYFHIGYKRYILPILNVNFSYNKFNLANSELYNEGFMSFDLNLESTILPHNRLSPFVFAGIGYNASNGFEQTAFKLQGGGGLEYMVADGFGLKLYTDYNYVMSDELDGIIAGASDDTYFRMGIGLNYYFGSKNRKSKILKKEPSIIDSNQIISHN